VTLKSTYKQSKQIKLNSPSFNEFCSSLILKSFLNDKIFSSGFVEKADANNHAFSHSDLN